MARSSPLIAEPLAQQPRRGIGAAVGEFREGERDQRQPPEIAARAAAPTSPAATSTPSGPSCARKRSGSARNSGERHEQRRSRRRAARRPACSGSIRPAESRRSRQIGRGARRSYAAAVRLEGGEAEMDAALGLVGAAPAAVALVLAVGDARRAGHAADRAEAVGDERMLGQIVHARDRRRRRPSSSRRAD